MTPEVLVAVPVFGGLGAAVFLLIVALRGGPPIWSGLPAGTLDVRSVASRRSVRRAAIGAAVAAGIAVATRWPVAAAAGGALVYLWPRLVGGARAAQAEIARLEALATWTESLKDCVAGAVGLEEAIPATVPAAGPLLQPQLIRLVGRMRGREPLPAALARLADELDDPSADLVIAALILNARLRGGGLHQALEALAASAREELDMRRRVEAGRRSIRTGVKIVVAVTVGLITGLAVLSSTYLAPYRSALGQLVMVVVLALFGAGFAWLRRLADIDTPARFLHAASHTDGARTVGVRS